MQTPFQHMNSIELSRIRVFSDRAAALAEEGRDIIFLQTGEPDFGTPENIKQAAMRHLNRDETHYAPNRGIMPLRRAIAEKLERDNGVTADPASEILITSGAAEALFITVNALLGPGEEAIIIEPAFVNYPQLIRLAGGVPVIVRAEEETGWLPRVGDIAAAVTDKTRMIILNSPCNPTGAVYPRELLAEIASLALRHDLIVISDEVYEQILYDGAEHVSIASLPGMKERTVTINGFSKTYAMTGWRLGYLAARADFIIPLLKIHQYCAACSPTFLQHAAVDALQGPQDDVRRMVDEYTKRRAMLATRLAKMTKIRCSMPRGAFYCYLNIAGSGMSSDRFAAELLEQEGVSTVPGLAFETSGADHIRISFATSYKDLETAFDRIERFVSR